MPTTPSTSAMPPAMASSSSVKEARARERSYTDSRVLTSATGRFGFAVATVNPNLPVADVKTLESVYDRSLARASFTLLLLAIAGGMALVLGVVGIYGVFSYAGSPRAREIGVPTARG